MTILLITGILLSSLAWLGDIVSWAWIGNGFTIDVILLVIAIIVTFGVILYYRNFKQKAQETNSTLASTELLPAQLTDENINALPITCPSCGDIFQFTNELCPSCGSEKPKCFVCLSDFSFQDTIVKTSCCQKYAHKEHILNWLNINGRCPECKQEITKDDLIEVSFIY